MAFNGSGTFNRVHNWQDDADNAIDIEPDRHDEEDDGFATGLSSCIAKDGQTTITGNIPFNGRKITGYGTTNAPTARSDVPILSQVQDQAFTYCGTSGGTANAQTLTPSPAITAYAAGQRFQFLPTAANTSGTVTLATSGLSTRNLKKSIGGALVILAVGDLQAAIPADISDDGTQYVLLNPRSHSHGADIASASTVNLDTATGDVVDVTGTTTWTAVTLAEGRQCLVRHTGAQLLTNGASLVLLGAANITTAAGDISVFRGYASGVVRQVAFHKLSGAPVSMLPIMASLGADVALNNTGNYFDGPSVAQGSTGTWFVSGTVTLTDTAGAAVCAVKLWDGTNIIASAEVSVPAASNYVTVALSGYIISPAGNLRISAKDGSSTSGKIIFNASGNSKDSTITALCIA